jgi:hypothetical protein
MLVSEVDMNPKPSVTGEKKNQRKMEELLVPDKVAQTMGLREAVVALNQRAPLREAKSDVRRILNGLQRGVLASGFLVDSDPIFWVAIPATYWLQITEKQFKIVRDNAKGNGAYLVSPQEFATEYALAIAAVRARRHLNDKSWATSTLVETLVAATKKFEVRLLRTIAWDDYQREMLTTAIEDSALASTKNGSGAREKAGWKQVYRALTVHLIANNITSKQQSKLKDLAKLAAEQAYTLNEGDIDLPGTDAIIDEISEMFGLLAREKK